MSFGADNNYAIYINPALVLSWGEIGAGGKFSIHFEGEAAWGETEVDDFTLDRRGLGVYLDGLYEYADGGNIALAGFFVDGNSETEVTDHTLVSMGDFAPFLVAFNGTTLGNSINSTSIDLDLPGTGYWGIGILGNHALTPEISLNYGIGYLQIVNTRTADFGDYAGKDRYVAFKKDLGWEIDLGFNFQLLDNLYFQTQFGYMFTGRAFDIDDGRELNGDPRWLDADDAFAWANVIGFTF
jgi:hypothetical protein